VRKFQIALTLFVALFGCALFAQKPAPADRVLENAKSQAAQQRKLIFLVFGASWCGPCHMQDAFMAAPETRPILEKYFVPAKLNVEEEVGKHPERNSPGGEELLARFGGVDARGKSGGVPFLVLLDASGDPIVNSNRPVKGPAGSVNIGYPSAPEEIDWFMSMLNKAVPTMTADETRTIDSWLKKHHG
jgi:thiol-disulfide isomerase/thioredoxin